MTAMKTTEQPVQHLRKAALCLFLPLALGACATGPNADPRDPLEPYNLSLIHI